MVPTFEKRVRAFAIDTSGVTLLMILSIPLGYEIAKYILIGAPIVFYLLPYLFLKGQSFGKLTQKIKIVTVDGLDVPLWRILLREVFKLGLSFATFGVYLVVSFFFMNDKTSRTIHDYIFKTKMIDLKPDRVNNNVLGTSESLRRRGL